MKKLLFKMKTLSFHDEVFGRRGKNKKEITDFLWQYWRWNSRPPLKPCPLL
jgi:hypothetical protein